MLPGMKTPLHIVWFKRDLRARDHEPLAMAAARGPVLPLYVIEPAFWAEADAAGRHWDFIAESLEALRADLARLGQPLVVRQGDMIEVLDKVARGPGIAALYSHQETGNGGTYARDSRVAAWCKAQGIAWHEPVQGGVVRRLGTRNGWAKRMDQHLAEPQIAAPHIEPLNVTPGPIIRPIGNDPCPGRQTGGRDAGLTLLGSFLTDRAKPYRRAMSAPEPGAVHCSRLSPHLAFGTLSIREVAQATWARQREVKETGERGFTGSLSSFNGRLHWRDHFMQKLEDAPRLEWQNMHRGMDHLSRESDAARLHAFTVGETGLPFVDACLRCLNATGWMNFRMRAMLQAVASYHLWLPWRDSGLVLARWFTDYEPGIHWSQVQMQSGTTGINTVRVYNPVKQGYDQDPNGTFIHRWVPQLRGREGAALHEPWKHGGAQGYPDPIVDHEQAARDAKAAVYAARKGDDFRAEADRIQTRHGSRKSGIRNRGARPKKPTNQLTLDL